uniref:Ig-like domain-containing protein n=1 Tax=Callorhinchus milii TaxID=7868 RepID=A0A4W3GFL2_CALMI
MQRFKSSLSHVKALHMIKCKVKFHKQIVLCLQGVSGQDTVSQSPLPVTVAEKEQVIISCSTTESRALQWYRQYPNQALKHLVTGQTGEQQKERITATMNYRDGRSNLSITGTEVTDAATYLCAVETQ